MAVEVGTILARLDLRDKMSRKLDAAKGKFKQFAAAAEKSSAKLEKSGRAMQNAGNQMRSTGMAMTASITAPIVAFAAKSALSFADFESGMNRVRAVTGATGSDFEKLEGQAQDLGRTTKFTATESAEAMGFFGLAGFKTNEILAAMPGTLNLAAAGVMEVGQAADIVSKTLRGYGMGAKETARVSDVMAKAFTMANTDLTQLGHAMRYAGPVAKSAGLEFENTTAALALMADAGFQGTMGGTALRGAMVKLLAPTSKGAKIMEEFGLKATDASGRLLPFDQIVTQLEPHADKTGKMMELFGLRAGPAMAALVTRGGDAIKQMTAELKKAGGTTKRIADIQMEGLKGAMIKLQSATEGMFIAVGKQLSPSLISLLEDLKSVVTYIQQDALPAFNALPGWMQKVGIGAVGVTAAAGPLLLIFGQLGSMLGGLMLVISGVSAGLITKAALLGALVVAAKAVAIIIGVIIAIKFLSVIAQWIEKTFRLGEVFFRLKMRLKGWNNAQIDAMMSAGNLKHQMEGQMTTGERLEKTFADLSEMGVEKLTEAMHFLAEQGELSWENMDLIIDRAIQLKAGGKELGAELTKLIQDVDQYQEGLAIAAEQERRSTQEHERHTEAVDKLIRSLGTSGALTRLTDLTTAWGALSEDERVNEAVVEDVIAAYKSLIPKIGATNKELNQLGLSLGLLDFKDLNIEIVGGVDTHGGKDFLEWFPWLDPDNFPEPTKMLDPSQIVGGITTVPAAVPFEFGASLAKNLKAGLFANLKSVPKTVVQALTGGGGILNAFRAIGSQVGSTIGGGIGKTWASGIGKRIASGENVGKLMKGFASMAGPIGAAVGALAGPLIGALTKLFSGPTTQESVTKASRRMFNHALSTGLADAIAATRSKTQSDFGAMMVHMADILKEMGGIQPNTAGIDAAISRVRDIFVAVETGAISTQQGAQSFNDSFKMIADAVVESGGIAGQEFLELIELAQRFGMTAETFKFVEQNIKAAAVGLAQLFGPTIEEAKGYNAALEKNREEWEAIHGPLQSALDDYEKVAAAFKEGKASQDELDVASAKYNQTLAEYHDLAAEEIELREKLNKLASLSGEELEDLGTIAVASFESALAAGMSFTEAVEAHGPALDAIIDAQKELGIESDNAAIKELTHFQDRIRNNKGLVTAVEALDDTMLALSRTGSLNAETLGAMERQGSRMYDKLIEKGFTQEQAVLMMGPALKTIMEAHEKLGIPVDENTQRLIDQAKEAGLLEDEQKSGWASVTTAVGALVSKMDTLITRLMGVKDKVNEIPSEINIAAHVSYTDSGIDTSGQHGLEFAAAHGGIVTRPSVGLVGEAGPEAIIPLTQLEFRDRALLAEVRGLKSELRNLPIHLRDAILLAQ